MVQKKIERPRGRPRSHDADVTLSKAMDAFWYLGYSGTSLNDLCKATDLNRPSLYLVFDDKRAFYVAALKRYIEQSGRAVTHVLDQDTSIDVTLKRFYGLLLDVFQPKGNSSRGCFMIATAVPEAAGDAEIQTLLFEAVAQMDLQVSARLQRAHKQGELRDHIDPMTAAQIVIAVVHTFAVRSRAGETRRALTQIADTTVALLCLNKPLSHRTQRT